MKVKEKQISKFKEVSALLHAYQSLEKEFTKRCQRIKELESKISKDSVVLSREELNEIINQTKETEKNYYKRVVIPQERKETAEKFESELKAFIKVWKMAEDDAMSIPFYRALFEKIGELAKQ